MIIKDTIYQPIILKKITNKENNNFVEITLLKEKTEKLEKY